MPADLINPSRFSLTIGRNNLNHTHVSAAPLLVTRNISRLTVTALMVFSAISFSAASVAEPWEQNSAASATADDKGSDNASARRAKLAHKQETEKQTLALAGLMADYRHGAKSNKPTLKQELIARTRARQALLRDLVKTDPAAAVHSLLPASARAGMPEEVLAILTQKRELEGELEVTYVDYADVSQSHLRHTLITDSGRVELHLGANSASWQTGARVKAKGWMFNDSRQDDSNSSALVLFDEPENLMLLADDGTAISANAVTATSLTNTLGEQRTLILLVNFQDNTSQPWTVAQVEDMVFGTVNDYYQEASYGQTWLSGDVLGYYSLPMNDTCSTSEIAHLANQAATENGVDLGVYERMLYIFPQSSHCSWSGKGTVGGTPSKTWINGSLSLRTVGHELGHNLGLHHAKKWECGADVLSGDCYGVEYGDNLDIMGSKGISGHFNAFNKDLLGWFNNGASSAQIITADTDGSYLLDVYETAPMDEAQTKGLKIFRGNDAITGQKLWYYLEYRQPLGFDEYLSYYLINTSGPHIHLGTAQDASTSQLIDMSPDNTDADWSDSVLPVGAHYTDSNAGVTITTDWANETGASIRVSYSGLSCIKSNPSLSLLPNESAWVTAGTLVTYSATVINNDSEGCTATRYELSAAVPTTWSASGNSLSLMPGASGTVTLIVNSATDASDGFYDIVISATNSSESIYSHTGMVSYVVNTPIEACVLVSPQLKMTVNDSGEVDAGTEVTYWSSLTNLDSAICEPSTFDLLANTPSGWHADRLSVTLAPGETTSFRLNITSATSAATGVYDFDVIASNRLDDAYQSGAPVTYNLVGSLPSCTAATPSLVLVPSQFGDLAPGTRVNYSATITNNDSEGCGDTDFDVYADVPALWSATNTRVSLSPGGSTVVSIGVTSDASATAGSYPIGITVRSVADSSNQLSTSVSYVLGVGTNTGPVAVNDSMLMASKTPVLIDVLANDWDGENDVLKLVSVSQGAKGSVQITLTGQLLYTPAKRFKRSDSFSYSISDGIQTSTATVFVSLSSSGDGGGNKGQGKK